MDLSKLEPCDFLVYKGGGIIGGMDRGFVHVAVVSEIIGDKVQVIQGHLWAKDINGVYRSGVMESWVDPAEYDKIVARRYFIEIPLQNRVEFIEYLRREVVGKVNYNLFAFPRLWIWSNILTPLGLGNLDVPLITKHGEVCSTWPNEHCPKMLKDINGWRVDPLPGLEPDSGTPADYAYSLALVTIFGDIPEIKKPIFNSDYNTAQPA